MILPKKYLKLEHSIIGISAVVFEILKDNVLLLDSIYEQLCKKKSYNSISIDTLILTIDYMFMCGSIKMNKEGGLYICA